MTAIRLISITLMLLFLVCVQANAFPVTDDEIASVQSRIAGMGAGERIAQWATLFVDTPYDPDPMGVYVSTRRIVADAKVDCMYMVFRSVELALANSPADAVQNALELRFATKGVLSPDGLVMNYDERYQYAMDMVRSGKWGRNVTRELGDTLRLKGERGLDHVDILPAAGVPEALSDFMNGDVVYFIKDPAKRVVGEIVGHMGIVRIKGGRVYLIHASGRKNHGGRVLKVLLREYAGTMPFAGIIVTRFK